MGGIKLFSFTGLIFLVLTSIASLFVWNIYFDDDAQANIKRRVSETVETVKTYSSSKLKPEGEKPINDISSETDDTNAMEPKA